MTERNFKSSKIRIGDISISYYIKPALTSEPTETIIFIHGFPFNKKTWKPQLESLADNVTGIAIDVRGHGNTTAGHGFFSVDVFAKDLVVFIKKLDLEQVTLCGISMGGYIALRAYQLIPNRIKGLILCDTHARADDNKGKQKRFDSIQAILQYGRRPFAIGFVENVFHKDTISNNPEAVELIKSSIRRNSISSICATQLALASRTDTRDMLGAIPIPTLLIRGANDAITPKELMEELEAAIPQASYIEIENAGHLPNLEQPERFNSLLHEFLRNLQIR